MLTCATFSGGYTSCPQVVCPSVGLNTAQLSLRFITFNMTGLKKGRFWFISPYLTTVYDTFWTLHPYRSVKMKRDRSKRNTHGLPHFRWCWLAPRSSDRLKKLSHSADQEIACCLWNPYTAYFTKVSHLFLSKACSIQHTPSYTPTTSWNILILPLPSTHSLPSCLCPNAFRNKMWHAFLHISYTCCRFGLPIHYSCDHTTRLYVYVQEQMYLTNIRT